MGVYIFDNGSGHYVVGGLWCLAPYRDFSDCGMFECGKKWCCDSLLITQQADMQTRFCKGSDLRP